MSLSLHTRVELSHRIENAQSCTDGSAGIVFVSPRIAEIDEQSVSQELSDVPVVASDDLRAGVLV